MFLTFISKNIRKKGRCSNSVVRAQCGGLDNESEKLAVLVGIWTFGEGSNLWIGSKLSSLAKLEVVFTAVTGTDERISILSRRMQKEFRRCYGWIVASGIEAPIALSIPLQREIP